MTDLFTSAKAARDEAVDRVGRNAPTEWKNHAAEAVLHCARMAPIFTADEVWQRLEILNQAEGANPKALGAVMSSLARDGVIVTTGNYRKSTLARRHQRPVAEWRLT
jgi:hypothetical protein